MIEIDGGTWKKSLFQVQLFSFNLFSVVIVAGKALFSLIEKVVYMIFNREREKTHNKCLFFDSFHDILGKLR